MTKHLNNLLPSSHSLDRTFYSFSWDVLLAVSILLEAGFLFCFYHEGYLDVMFNEIGFAVSSLAVAVLLMVRYWNSPVIDASRRSYRFLSWISYLFLAAGIIGFCDVCQDIFISIPIGPATSDVIPTIQIAVRRLLSGAQVYSLVEFDGWGFPMTYLPMTWMPYVVAEIGDFDYRWIAVAIACLASAVMVVRCGRVSGIHALLATFLILCTGRMLLLRDPAIIGMSVELMVAGYYMLLIAALCAKSPYLRGAAIAVCMLSRFSLILWLPLWAFTEFMLHRRSAIKSFVVIALLLLVLYIIPFLSRDWSYLGIAVASYSGAAENHWQRYVDDGTPYILKQGVGFARLFCDSMKILPVADRLHVLQKVHLWLCIGIPGAMGVLYWIWGRKRLNTRIFLLASFKIYLTVFLCFIQMPFTYLMLTAVGVSIAIFAETGHWKSRLIEGPEVE